MTVLMRIVELGGQMFKPGVYLRSFDHEAFDGQGNADFTDEIADAMRFADHGKAMEFWNRIPKCKPLRPDGKPNKPLSATTVEIVKIA